MVKKLVQWCAIVVMGVQLGGCYTEYGPVVTDSEPVAPYRVGSRLQTGDQLKVIVFGEDALSGIYEISPSGSVTMPLVGSVMAAGRTTSEVGARSHSRVRRRQVPARSQNIRISGFLSALLHLRRGDDTWQIRLCERHGCADCSFYSGRLHLSGQSVNCSDPPPRGGGVAGIFPGGPATYSTGRSHSNSRKVLLMAHEETSVQLH